VNRQNLGVFILRVGLGLGFAFAGLHKFLPSLLNSANSPFTSKFFLLKATGGQWLDSDPKAIVNPTHDIWVGIAGNASLVSIFDTLVVFGEIAIGIALILGLATRFSGVMGALLMALIWVAGWSFANGPFNEAFYYGLMSIVIVVVGAGAYALDSVVVKLPVIQRIPVVKAALG
jgi:thiosulfate dehydrogenase [quinone] large subunit